MAENKVPQEIFSVLPKHIAVIMDGNGRWAKKRGLPRTSGHKQGVKAVDSFSRCCIKYGVSELSVYAFSTENWNRPEKEIKMLFSMIKDYFDSSIKDFTKNGVKVRVRGFKDGLSDELVRAINNVEEKTKDNTVLKLNIMFNYGGRQEILSAVNRLLKEGKSQVTKEDFEKELLTFDCLEPDLIIRTSGEYRLSNFLLYQCAYSELYFTDVLWPSFSEKDFVNALDEYQNRQRRFGKV